MAASRTCPECGRQYPADRKFCEIDGVDLSAETRPVARAGAAGAKRTSHPDSGSRAQERATAPNDAPVSTVRARPRLARETIVGLATVALIVAAVGAVFAWRKFREFTIQVSFEEAHGLKVGDTVYVRGADVGEVFSTEFAGNDPSQPFVAGLRIQPEKASQIRRGSAFFVAQDKIFLNKKCVQIFVQDPTMPALEKGGVVRGEDSVVKYLVFIAREKGLKEFLKAKDELRAVFGAMVEGAKEQGARRGG